MKKTKKRICLLLVFAIAVMMTFFCRTEKASAATVVLPYEVSAQYRSSKYYSRLITTELTGDQRTDIVNIALSQVGYHEGNEEGQTSGDHPDGSGNVSEATYWFGTQVKGWKTGFNYSWCAIYISWCARLAGIPTNVISNSAYACAREQEFCFQNVTFHNNDGSYDPQPGDLVFFDWDTNDYEWDHVEMVTDCISGYLFTVGGNARDTVAKHAFDLNEKCIKGYGEPKYTVSPSEHDFSEWEVLLEPTCETKGVKQRICSDCNLVETAEISELGHQYYQWGHEDEWVIDKEATCQEEGEKSFHCLRCSHRDNITAVPKTTHKFDDWTVDKEPTCTEAGQRSHYCIFCGETEDTQIMPATGHDISAGWTIDKAPTCTEEGERSLYCSACGEILETEIMEPLGHTFSEEWTVDIEPDCENKGEKSHHCTACDERTDVTEIEPLGHEYVLDHTKEATCTEVGADFYICTHDPSHIMEIAIPMIDHTLSEWVIRREPSYAEDGERFRYCKVCEAELETESIPRLTEYVPPYGFIRAGEYEWSAITKEPSGNIYFNTSVSITVSAFDDDSGVADIMCIASESVLSDSELALTEKWTEGTGLRLNKDGVYLIYARITDVSGNVCYISTDFIEVDMTEPTSNGIVDGGEYCREAMFTAEDKNLLSVRVNGMNARKNENGTYCINASPYSQKVEIIDAAGNLRTFTIKVNEDHIFSEYIINRSPTCLETGVRHRECTVCGEVHYETIPQYGHDYSDEWTVINEPSCTSTGTEARVCSRCNDMIDERSVAALGHDYVNGKCTVCGKESSDTIPYEAIVAAVIFAAIAVGVFIWERKKNRYV